MEFLDLVKSRRSVRTFDGKMIDDKVLNELKDYGETIENPYGIKVRFVFLDAKENKLSSPVIAGDTLYISAIVNKDEHAEEAYGYSFEKLLIKAHELGLGTVWIGGAMQRDKFAAASNVSEGEILPCVSPVGITANSMSIKEKLMRKGVKADKRFDFEKLFFTKNFTAPLSEESAKNLDLYKALEAIRVAPSAVNKQPWRIVIEDNAAHFYLRHDKGYANDDFDMQKIDLGIALYHFEQQLLSEGKSVSLEITNPDIQAPDGVEYIATYKF